MLFDRSSGILMHPSSLPSKSGIGDFGPAAYRFVDWLTSAKQTLWQILPLGPVGYGNSPYSCTSAFAGNDLLISLERFIEWGLLDASELISVGSSSDRVNFEQVRSYKLPLLRKAARKFVQFASGAPLTSFKTFCQQNAWWLEDYVLFAVLREKYGDQSWNSWPHDIVHRQLKAIEQVKSELKSELDEERFLQFAFWEQWRSLRQYCNARGVRIIGDVAIFVSYDCADVWTHPDIFRLNEELEPLVVAGVPPDAFSETGQRWGNPLYDWDKLKSRGYDWWISRMRWAIETCDIVRLDHFRGFEAYWEIPAGEPTAVNGHWVPGPNQDLFDALLKGLGKLPFIAEDLGYITKPVRDLRMRLQIPGMKVMQFGFGDRGAHIYLPHKFDSNCVVYTGTHDNDTTLGWWNSCATDVEKRLVREYMGIEEDGVSWAFIRSALTSVAGVAVIPIQDVLGLDSDARMNVPSQTSGNWSWRLPENALTPELAEKMASLTVLTDRDLHSAMPSD